MKQKLNMEYKPIAQLQIAGKNKKRIKTKSFFCYLIAEYRQEQFENDLLVEGSEHIFSPESSEKDRNGYIKKMDRLVSGRLELSYEKPDLNLLFEVLREELTWRQEHVDHFSLHISDLEKDPALPKKREFTYQGMKINETDHTTMKNAKKMRDEYLDQVRFICECMAELNRAQ